MPPDDPPPNPDDALIERLAPRIHSLINSALASHNKNADKKRLEDREATKVEFGKLLDEKFLAFRPAEPDDPGKKGKGRSKEDDLEFNTLKRSLEDLRQQNEAALARAQRERAKNIDSTERNAVFEALGAHGLDQVRAKAAYALFKMEGRIETSVDEETDAVTILIRGEDGQQEALTDGVKRWVKTDSAKIYLPPSGAKGAGSRPNSSTERKGPATPEEVRKNLGEALKNALL